MLLSWAVESNWFSIASWMPVISGFGCYRYHAPTTNIAAEPDLNREGGKGSFFFQQVVKHKGKRHWEPGM